MISNIFMIISFIFIPILPCFGEYYCWEDSERLVLTFKNNPNRNITYLPTIRLIQGYYPSQFAMQYAAYVYLKEKMGLNVTFYPDNDPDALFTRYAEYTEWCGHPNSTQSSCSPYAPYPRFYFEDIKNNEYDLLFEIWDSMVRDGKGFDYIEEDLVTHGGVSGVYGEGGWFIPKYIYDTNPEWILPQNLKYNESLRELFIAAYTNHSDRDYIERWWNGWSSDLEGYLNMGYTVPNYSLPVVFGSYEGYANSKYSNDLANNLFNGMNWTFAPFGSEANLTEFIIDLYAKELPFIANLYSPHKDFATILPNTSEYMQFEHIAFPRNPNNDVTDVCYENGQCAFPLNPLLKMGNPILLQEFPEILTFLLDFQMTNNDVNGIIAYYTETESTISNQSKHEQWIDATCKWLKQKQDITDEWHIDIIRYDCIFEDTEDSGCGFTYFYKTFTDALMQQNEVNTSFETSIAGSCTYNADEPLCDCPSGYFVGDTCRHSCPGVIGPIQDDVTKSSEAILIDNYTFYVCSAHGGCQMRYQRCDCYPGYGGDGCEIEYQVFRYDTWFIIGWCILFMIVIVILIISGVWIFSNKRYKTIRALSPNITLLFTLGLILLCIGTVTYLFHPLNDVLCNVRSFIYGIGAVLTIMAPLCKTYRVAIIFAHARNLRSVVLPDKTLLMYVLYAVVVETIICVVYTVSHQLNDGIEIIYSDEYERIEYKCNQSTTPAYVNSANYLYIFTLIMLLCFFSFKSRDTHKVFKESRCVYFGSFFSLFVFLVVGIFNVVVEDISVIVTIQSGAMLITICVIWVLFYGKRMYEFFMFPDDRGTVIIQFTKPKKKDKGKTYSDDKIAPTGDGSSRVKGKGFGVPNYVNELYKQCSERTEKRTDATLLSGDNDNE